MKKTKKVSVSAKSKATKKAPTARLKKRRAKNTVKGYYPNPTKNVFYLIKKTEGIKYYWTGTSWNSNIENAKHVSKKDYDNVFYEAEKAFKKLRGNWELMRDSVKKK